MGDKTVHLSEIKHGDSEMKWNINKMKFVYKPFTTPSPSFSEHYASDWNVLDTAVDHILSHQPLLYSKNCIYQACETACWLGQEEQLFERVLSKCTKQIDASVTELVEELLKQRSVYNDTTLQTENDLMDDYKWLLSVVVLFKKLNESHTLLKLVLAPLDRGFVLNSDAQSIQHISHLYLRDTFKTNEYFLKHTLYAVLHHLNDYRHSSTLHNNGLPVCGSVIKMLDCLNMYTGDVEESILSATRTFYKTAGNVMVKDTNHLKMTIVTCVATITKRLEQETEIVGSILMPQTIPFLKTIVLEEMLQQHATQLLLGYPEDNETIDNSQNDDSILNKLRPTCGLYVLMLSEDFETLCRIYEYYKMAGCLQILKLVWHECIKAQGFKMIENRLGLSNISSSATHSIDFKKRLLSLSTSGSLSGDIGTYMFGSVKKDQRLLIQDLLHFKLMTSRVVSQIFKNDELFEFSTKDAWELFLNVTPEIENLIASLLAKYTDDILRSGRNMHHGLLQDDATSTHIEDKESQHIALMDIHLDRIISLFKLIQAKDLYKAFYRKDLSKRLLLGKTASMDDEIRMVKKLKDECGSAFTAKMEGMFRELDVSKATFKKFEADPEYQHVINSTNITFECHVLASGIWPSLLSGADKLPEPVLPPSLVVLQEAYTQFYKQLQKGRHLQWICSLGTCCVKAQFGLKINSSTRKHDLIVSQIQALCLLLFNAAEILTVKEIQEATNIDEADIHRHLLALVVDPKKKILLKSPEHSREMKLSDTYTVNTQFTSRLTRVVINQIMLKDTKEEVEDTEAKVEEDRTYHIDALIVRIMKMKKELSHNSLISEILSNIKYRANLTTIKTRIEMLIDREFLERDTDDLQLYRYVA